MSANVLNYFDQALSDGDNALNLNGTWNIGGVEVTATADDINTAADLVDESSSNAAFSQTWGTAFSPAVSAAIRYTKFDNTVTLYIPAISGTTVGSTQKIISVTALPAAIRPTVVQNCIVIVNDGTNVVAAKAIIGTDGIITIGSDLTGANFAATTAVGVVATTVTYELI